MRAQRIAIAWVRDKRFFPIHSQYGKGKVPYTREDKGKGKQREFGTRLRCFIWDGPHLVREFPKREALNALINKREMAEEDACLGSMQMLGTLPFMSKASP